MGENIYEVSRDEYVGFVTQINPTARTVKVEENEGVQWIKTYSVTTGKLLCTREIYLKEDSEGEEHYYVFEFPPNEDRIAPQVVRKITLDTKEEVQAFFDVLSKAMKGQEDNKSDD